MSATKTIECASTIIGPVNLGIANGEHRTVVFEDRNGVGFAMIDNDEAEVLLGAIGRPNYWKPGSDSVDAAAAVDAAIAADPQAQAAAGALLGAAPESAPAESAPETTAEETAAPESAPAEKRTRARQ